MSKYFFAVLLVWHVLSLSDGSAVGVGGNTGFLVKTAISPVSAAALSPVSSAPEKQLAGPVRLSGGIRAFTVLLAASLLLCVTAVTFNRMAKFNPQSPWTSVAFIFLVVSFFGFVATVLLCSVAAIRAVVI